MRVNFRADLCVLMDIAKTVPGVELKLLAHIADNEWQAKLLLSASDTLK